MSNPRGRIGVIMSVAALVAAISACGDDDAGSAAATTAAPAGGTTVTVALGETSDAMSMELGTATAPHGAVTFVVTNNGTREHEFVVVKTDLATADPPFDAQADEVKEDELTVVDEIEEVAVGETKSLTVDLEAGHYALICNLERHFRLGMRADFDVSG